MGAWFRWIHRLFVNILPKNWAITVSFVPHGAGLLGAAAKTLLGGAANTYGNLAELLSDANNTSDCWVEALVLANPTDKTLSYFVALSREAAAAPPTVIEAEVPHYSETTIQADDHEVYRLPQRIYFPSGTGIRAAAACSGGAKSIDVWAIISRGRGV